MKNINKFLIFFVFMFVFILNINTTKAATTTIDSIQDLYNVRNDLEMNYVLSRDLDFDDITSYDETVIYGYDDVATFKTAMTSGEGWIPIDADFAGIFDGANYKIKNLYMNKIDVVGNIGLFSQASSTATLTNIALEDIDITLNFIIDYDLYYNTVGGLVGRNYGVVSNGHASGTLVVDGFVYIGGLVGYNEASAVVMDSYAICDITQTDVNDQTSSGDYSYVGGLVGENYGGTITNSYATGNVSGMFDVGGLVGYSYQSAITNSYATGSVSGTGDYVGGLAGENYGTITTSYATGNVNGIGDYVGGLIGESGGTITTSYATGNVSGTGDYVGGLIGDSSANIINSYAIGNVSGVFNVGGLIGESGGTITTSYATGSVSGTRDYVGGLVGISNGYYTNITTSYATGNVSGSSYVGGLVGGNLNGTITTSYATGNINGRGSYVGGFGGNASNITTSYATGNVIGGGFVGGFGGNASNITTSYAIGNVSGSSNVGGFAGGLNGSLLEDNYSTGSVTLVGSYSIDTIGGFIGTNYGSLINNYSTSRVYYEKFVNPTNRGFIGSVGGSGTDVGCYFDIDLSGQTSSAGSAQGKTSLEMTNVSTFVDWDFIDTWTIENSSSYPYLQMQSSSVVNNYPNTIPVVMSRFSNIGTNYSLTLNWDAIITPLNYTFLGYDIYKNDTKIVSATTSLEYVDTVLSLTNYDYYLVAKYQQQETILQGVSNHIILNFSPVATPADLNNVRNNFGLSYIQTADIDLNVSPYNTGSGWAPIGTLASNFTGGFDGNGYKITNLFISRSTTDYIGLFGTASTSAILKNISLENVSIVGKYNVGGLVGKNYGTILNSYTTGAVTGLGTVGGFVGYNDGVYASIKNSYSKCSVTRSSGTSISVAGFLAYNYSGVVSNSYSTGRVYYAGATNPTNKGFIGDDGAGGIDMGNYFNTQTSLQTTTAGSALSRTTLEMTYPYDETSTTTYVDWGFNNIWHNDINSDINGGYPFNRIVNYSVNYSSGAGGVITGDSSQTIGYGRSTTEVTATPNNGFAFVEWSDHVTTASRTDSLITANKSVTASFSDSGNPVGTISINSGATYTTSTTVSLTLTASDNVSPTSSLQMMISNYEEFTGAGWENYSNTKNWTLLETQGVRTVYMKLKDESENISATTSDTIVLDNTAPTITILGLNPVSIYQSDTYSDTGATSTDNVDQNLSIQTTSNVNTSVIGSYTVTYTVSDTSNNTSTSTRVVNVMARPGGGGGGYVIPSPEPSNASSVVVTSLNGGTFNHIFYDKSVISIVVPTNTVTSNTTFTVSEGVLNTDIMPSSNTGAFMIGNNIFNITAIDINNNPITLFSNNITITITIPSFPDNTSNLGVYYYNTTTDSWILIPGATFNTITNKVTFTVNHLTKFAIFNINGTPNNIDTQDELSSWTNGMWIKTKDKSTVYFLDKNNLRHAYPNQSIWKSYFDNDFSFVKTISKEELASYQLDRNVPYNSGSMFKIPSIPKVYLVGINGNIGWIKTEEAAIRLYGNSWNRLVCDLPDSSFGDYTRGSDIE